MSEDFDDISRLMAEAADKAQFKLSTDVQTMVDIFTKTGLPLALSQNQVLIALSNVTGHLLACLPADQRAFVESQVLQNIPRQREIADKVFTQKENGGIDLASLDPKGRC